MDKNKKLLILRYQDEILKMHLEKIPIRTITEKINHKMLRTDLSETISKSTVANIINKLKKIRGIENDKQ